jgi:DNA-binding NarL/FixJ family response regulator
MGRISKERTFMNVFIVDDSSVVRDRLREMLSEIKEVEIYGEAENVEEALEMLKNTSPDLIILDIRLKEGNGFDLLKVIKQSHPDLKVIMLTNYPYPQYRERALEMGADHFFDKSVDFEKVIKVIKKILQEKKKSKV